MSVDLASVRIQATTLGDLLLTAADRHPDTAAVVLPDKRLSYAGLATRALRRARSLSALGIGPGDHVGLLLPTSTDFVES
ncbi:MAG: AMP-binding protein, partial [Pseudomonadota bacterium]